MAVAIRRVTELLAAGSPSVPAAVLSKLDVWTWAALIAELAEFRSFRRTLLPAAEGQPGASCRKRHPHLSGLSPQVMQRLPTQSKGTCTPDKLVARKSHESSMSAPRLRRYPSLVLPLLLLDQLISFGFIGR